MHYRLRHSENKLRLLAENFRSVLVLGARQTGKSTLLQHVFPGMKTFVFDPLRDIYGARKDPELFLDSYRSPLILDEIQYVPELVSTLKRRLDLDDRAGQYFMTGSQNLSVLKTISESMAGRTVILQIEPMTVLEMTGQGGRQGWLASYLADPLSLRDRVTGLVELPCSLTRILWRGALPGTLDLDDPLIPDFFHSYIQTYLERDVRAVEEIKDLTLFDRFLGLSAALTGQEINTSQLGREVGIVPDTSRRWLNLLIATYQWLELCPYSGNAIKRISMKRKGFLRDTGLACHLQRVSSPDALAVNPLLGAMFETWVVNALYREALQLPVSPYFYHWRTGNQGEVDLVLERDGRLYPVEVKCKTSLSGDDLRGLRQFRETYRDRQVMPGLVIYAGKETYLVERETTAIPWNILVGKSLA